MSRSAEEALVGRDRSLPGLGLVLDSERMLERLRALMPEGGLRSARGTYLRYKPGTSCLAAYRVSAAGGEMDVHAIARPTTAADKLHKTRGRASRPTHAARLFVIEDCAVVISVFPEDAGLPVLQRLASPERRRGVVRQLVGRHAGPGELEMVRYKPERRWVGRLTTRRGDTFALKAHDAAGFAASLRGTEAFQHRLPTHVPRLVAASRAQRIVALEWIPGRPLGGALVAGEAGCEEVRAAGAALAELHGQPIAALPTRTPLDRAEHVLALARALAFVQPTVAGVAEALAAEMGTRLALMPTSEQPTHGDFHAGQVLLAEIGPVLIDFDEAVLSEPAADCASFLAHLERDEIAGRLPPGRAADLGNALLDGYAGGGSRPRDADLKLHTAAALFDLAPQFFRDRDPSWPERTEAALDRAEALLGGCAAPARSRAARPGGEGGRVTALVSDPFGARGDDRNPFLAAALDPPFVQDRLRSLPELQARVPGLVVRGVRVLRHKPGRRCLIQYELAPSGAPAEPLLALGKVRARGTDFSTYRLVGHLAARGFAPHSEDGVSVAPPLGVVPELGMWLQARVGGGPATPLMAGDTGPRLGVRLADALHKLHHAPVSPRRTHTAADELAILRDRLERVARARPEWADRLHRLTETCVRTVARLEPSALALIHRDFYPDQVMVDGDRLHLVDLDLCAGGDPALDAGNFVGHLVEQALRLHGRPDALDGPAVAFVERFAERAGRGRAGAAAAGVYATLTLARHVWLSMQFPERRGTTAALLDLCERRLDLATGRGQAPAAPEERCAP